MSKQSRPPLPSQSFIPMNVSEQEMFPELSIDEPCEGLYRFESDLSAALIETAHLYGVLVTHVDLVYFGDNIFATMHLRAGAWTRQKTFGANRRKHPISRLCANLLRFMRREHEQLG